jgi:hypothetical protein
MWKLRAAPPLCQHRYLEVDGIALSHSVDNYYCIVCGKFVVRNHYEFLFLLTHLLPPSREAHW